MKKHPFSRMSHVVKSIFDVRRWSDYDRVKTYTTYLMDGVKKLFVPQKAASDVSFEEAMALMKISEADLKKQQGALYRLSVFMCVLAAGFFFYAVYHLFYGAFRAVAISLIVMCMALTLGFRYHFWYFQMKQRKLGCTFSEWYRQGLRGKTK